MSEDFWARIEIGGANDCWPWTGPLTARKNGYGSVWYRSRRWRAHRLAYRLAKGKIPDGLLVRHTCDNRLCCNPKHLLVGTCKDNTQDAIRRGRLARGSRGGRAILHESDIPEIRKMASAGVSYARIAASKGVATSTISTIIYGRNWKHA